MPGSVPAKGIARWDGQRWHPLGETSVSAAGVWFQSALCGFEPGALVPWYVDRQRLFDGGDRLYVGYEGGGVGLVASQSLIAWRDGAWEAQGETGLVLGAWDGGDWYELATPERGLPAPEPDSTPTFLALAKAGTRLIAAGYVRPENTGRHVYVYENGRFQAIGGGVHAMTVAAVAVTDDALWFGGSIAEVGSGEGLRASVGIARYYWGGQSE